MPKVQSARCRPRRRTAGRATSPARTAATTPPSEHAEHAVAAEDLAGDEGADADEEVLGQRDLTGQAGEGDERQGDGGDDERPHDVASGGRRCPTLANSATPPTSDDAGEQRRPQRGHRGLVAPDDAAGRQPERRHEQDGDDEEDAGDGEPDAG